MKKFVAFGLGAMMATMTFTACSNDDALDLNEQEIQQNTVSSYISVRITGSNFSSTRATTDLTDDDFEEGTGDETEDGVNGNVQFFFFDKDGKFLTKGNVMSDPTFSDPNTNENIERNGQAVVEIENFNSSNKPTMMVTLLNAPDIDGFEGEKTIADLRDHIYKNFKNGNKFIMTTSSYVDANNTKLDYTPLTESAFQTSGIYDAEKKVDVYVERVAAKITLEMKLNRFKDTDTPMYLGKFNVNGLDGTTKLYAKITGWGLNATAKQSYALKHLKDSWLTANTLGFDWNDASRYRSYWGESWNYGKDGQGNPTYSTNFPNYYGDQDKDNYTLTYWKGSELKNTAFDGTGVEYCFENTNSGEIINKNHVPATATCVLIKALLTDVNGTAFDNIVKFHGGYWTRDAALEVMLDKALAGHDYHRASNKDKKLTKDDVDWTSATYLNGHIRLKLNDDAKDVTWVDGDGTTDVKDEIDSLFEDYVNVEKGHPCVSYKAGMYYYAPINHLNYTNHKGSAEAESNVYAEGYYGVVRNHVYQVVVNGFKQLQDDPTPDPSKPDNSENGSDDPKNDPTNPSGDGSDTDPDDEPNIDPGHGIEDDNEPIVPNPEEDQNWYLSTQINILSWRVVSQYVKI
jgi:hypothetical protein